jgi:hypothetical protein
MLSFAFFDWRSTRDAHSSFVSPPEEKDDQEEEERDGGSD